MAKYVVLKRLEEFRDNMNKKTYLKKMSGSTDLLDNLDFILGIARETHYDESKDLLERFHSALCRIGSRILTRIFKDSYPKKDYKKINSKFKELCTIKDRYWNAYN